MRRYLILVVILTSCSKPSATQKETELVELINGLPIMATPITFNSDKPITSDAQVEQHVIDQLQKLIPGYGLIGKIFEGENFVAIIGVVPNDTGSPMILIFDRNGIKLDSYLLYETAGGDMGYESKNTVTINPSKEIAFVDSTWTMKLNKEGTNVVEGTDSLTVSRKKYLISDGGKILNIQ